MSFFERLSHLVKSDAHGVVDALEDRALVLRQHLREASAEVARKQAHLESLIQEDEDLVLEDGQLEARCAQLDRDIELALERDEDKLARFAVKKLLPLRQARQQIDQRRQRLAKERGDLTQRLSEQQVQLDELDRRVRGYLARLERGETGTTSGIEWTVAEEEVELELLRRSRGTASQGPASQGTASLRTASQGTVSETARGEA